MVRCCCNNFYFKNIFASCLRYLLVSKACQMLPTSCPVAITGILLLEEIFIVDYLFWAFINFDNYHVRLQLHHLGRSPRGAIAPVTYIWRRESNAAEERRIWLWVHAGAFEEALSCLQLLCQSQVFYFSNSSCFSIAL